MTISDNTVAIIGSGNIGSRLAAAFAAGGQDFLLAGRDQEAARKVAADLAGQADVVSVDEAVSEADYLVIDTPGGDTALSRRAHSRADLIVTPMNDSFVDFDLLGQVDPVTLDLLRPSIYSETVWESRKIKMAAARSKYLGECVALREVTRQRHVRPLYQNVHIIDVALELRRLVHGDLCGMFDGPTTPGLDLSAPLVVRTPTARRPANMIRSTSVSPRTWRFGRVRAASR